MITVIVVDDENIARRRLVRLLEETGEAKVVAECAGGRDAITRIAALQPLMVFLDVQMPDLDGFGVLQRLEEPPLPAIVFVTAFDQYAVRAFDVHAVDYLLKPYDTARFREAFARAKERIESRARTDEDGRLRALLREYLEQDAPPASGREFLDRVAVKVDGAIPMRWMTGRRRYRLSAAILRSRRATRSLHSPIFRGVSAWVPRSSVPRSAAVDHST